MADFSSSEKVNASWKHLFGLLGTSNADGSAGKFWYEEAIAVTHIITPDDIWSDNITHASTKAQAQAAASAVIEDRSSDESVTLVANGLNWNISTLTLVPKVGFQISDVHPNSTYVKAITNVVDLGSGNFTITLNNNVGVSAGAAVLQGRIYLTEDATTNGLAWFARSEVGNQFSSTIENFIQPQRFGQGYTVRVFQADGTEIYTTQGAWIFNWQKGLLLLANGFTADDEGYNKPLYIEAFRYTGTLGGSSEALPSGTLHDTLRFDGSNWVPNSSLRADGVDISVLNTLTVSGALIMPSGVAPSGTLIPGDEGELRYDNNYLYIRTQGKWKKTDLSLVT